jgi:hypothetical protein
MAGAPSLRMTAMHLCKETAQERRRDWSKPRLGNEGEEGQARAEQRLTGSQLLGAEEGQPRES